MNFGFTDDQESLRDLAVKVLDDHCPAGRPPDPFDADLWSAVVSAGLAGAAFDPPAGAGQGLMGLCIVAEELGRRAASLPLWGNGVAGLVIGRYAPALAAELLPALAEGTTIAALAFEEAGVFDPRDGATTARPVGDGRWRVDGIKVAVPYAGVADRFLIAAASPDGPVLVVADAGPAPAGGSGGSGALSEPSQPGLASQPGRSAESSQPGHPGHPGQPGLSSQPGRSAESSQPCEPGQPGQPRQPGIRVEAAESTDGEPAGTVVCDGLVVGADSVLPAAALEYALDTATAVLCATTAGVVDGGLHITAGYIAERHQFGRPIASFQGPALRIADAYIDAQAVWTSAWSAIWRLETGRPAQEELAIAKFWAADGGQRAVHAFQHLHGGMGVDTSYPIHRYFYMAKALEVRLGGATAQLERLGAALADDPAEGA